MDDLVWEETPDGRLIAHGDDLSRHLAYPPTETKTDLPEIAEFAPFIEGCLALYPEITDAGARAGFSLFILGATDRFWYRFEMDDQRFTGYAQHLLQRFGLDAEQAATLATRTAQLSEHPPARQALRQGAETLDLWLDSRDANVMLRVKDLLITWQRAFALSVSNADV